MNRICSDILVLSATPINPAKRKMLPAATNQRGPFASKTGPICTPQKNVRKAKRLKIQPMLLGECCASWCVLRYAWKVPTLLRMPKEATMPLNEPKTTSQAATPPSGYVWSSAMIAFSVLVGSSLFSFEDASLLKIAEGWLGA